MYAVAGILIAVAVVCTVVPLLMQYASQTSMSASASSIEQQVRLWPESRIDDELRAARAYNRDLVRSGQPVLGAQADPFSNGERLSSQSAQDQRYGRLLNEGHGIMGRVSIPKISVDLPIYHGTGDKQLSLGSGHLYGTSLPVGGNNTHAVITGHRGMVQAQMFTRLDEMREGDFIYISTMNRTLAYEVDRITVIEPTDTSQLRIVPGQDRLTLMTCTPYGINSHRLLVSGHRVSMPVPAPDPTDLHDGRTVGASVRRKGHRVMPLGCDWRSRSGMVMPAMSNNRGAVQFFSFSFLGRLTRACLGYDKGPAGIGWPQEEMYVTENRQRSSLDRPAAVSAATQTLMMSPMTKPMEAMATTLMEIPVSADCTMKPSA